MGRAPRLFALLLLAVMLPVQASAAACAQICEQMRPAGDAAPVMDHAAHDTTSAPEHEHCHDNDLGAGKCCQFHTFMFAAPDFIGVAKIPAVKPNAFIARWTSFIPEEPSPPPIAA